MFREQKPQSFQVYPSWLMAASEPRFEWIISNYYDLFSDEWRNRYIS